MQVSHVVAEGVVDREEGGASLGYCEGVHEVLSVRFHEVLRREGVVLAVLVGVFHDAGKGVSLRARLLLPVHWAGGVPVPGHVVEESHGEEGYGRVAEDVEYFIHSCTSR